MMGRVQRDHVLNGTIAKRCELIRQLNTLQLHLLAHFLCLAHAAREINAIDDSPKERAYEQHC